MVKKNKLVMWIVIGVVALFLIYNSTNIIPAQTKQSIQESVDKITSLGGGGGGGGGGAAKSNPEMLVIDLYDINKNKIGESNTFAIYNNIPNVEYINIRGIVRNTGDVQFSNSLLIITGPNSIMSAFVENTGTVCSFPAGYTDHIGCTVSSLQPGDIKVFNSGLIQINRIPSGMNTLTAKAYANIISGNESKQIESDLRNVSFIISPNPPGTPGIDVEIGVSVEVLPSTTTSYTINVNDALATTFTSLYPDYYIFDDTQLVKQGTLNTFAISLPTAKRYQMILISPGASGIYSQTAELNAVLSEQTANFKMTRIGAAKIYKIINPLEGAGSQYYNYMALAPAQTKAIDIQFGANVSQKGFNRPIIICLVNMQSILSMSISSFDDGKMPITINNIPKRIPTTPGYINYAWEYPGMIDPTQPIITAHGSITSTNLGPSNSTDKIQCNLVDQERWRIAQYQTANSIDNAFKFGPENAETLSDVGGPDSGPAFLYLNNPRGI